MNTASIPISPPPAACLEPLGESFGFGPEAICFILVGAFG